MEKRHARNPKRRIAEPGHFSKDRIREIGRDIQYVGSPYHKRNPADYGLIPPAAPRPGKTLCDGDGTYLTKAEAQKLLRAGANLGLISQNCLSIWPENVWMVYNDIVYEARLQNSVAGEYHGYPLMADDPFREVVLKVWHERQRT